MESQANHSSISTNKNSSIEEFRKHGGYIKRNMYETLESNYAEIFVDYQDVKQDVIIFANDSFRLGDNNKMLIQAYARTLGDTDVISVIGCSHGTTALHNGNEILALGRANRVKEALLIAGVSHNKIHDEGCWAPVPFDGIMPSRGVLITLKRRI